MGKLGVTALLAFALSAATAGGAAAPRVLYGLSGDLWVAAIDGSSNVRLTWGTHTASTARWSPDGTRVAFATNHDTDGHGGNEIYVVNPDGTGLTRLTFGATTVDTGKYSPVWAPDGSRIAFGYATSVWSVPSAGGTATKIADVPVPAAPVAWSSDGTTILARGQQGAGDLYAIHPVDGTVRDLGNLQYPVYSPDGKRIAFQDARGHVSVMNADATGARELTDMSSTQPTWIDDHRLAFTGNHVFTDRPADRFGYPSRTNVYVVDADSAAAAQRITGSIDEFLDWRTADQPHASPDGQQLLFRWSLGNSGQWRMNVDGTCPQPVPAIVTYVDDLAWQPGAAPGRTDCAELWLALFPTVDKNPVALGERATETVSVENHGNEAAHHVVVRGSATTPGTTVGGCLADGCDLGTIAPNDTAQFSFTISSARAQLAGAAYTVSADEPSPAPQLATSMALLDVRPCTLVGTLGADKLYGTPRRDRICGLAGADYVTGGKGDDWIDAGNGNDTVYGGPGRDTIFGRDGRDTIFARDGVRDTIDCGPSYDVAVVDALDTTIGCERVLRH